MPIGMLADKKKIASVIIDGGYDALKKGNESFKGHGSSGETEVPSDDSIALESAAEEILAAVQKKDARSFAEAMKAFMELCSMETETNDEP